MKPVWLKLFFGCLLVLAVSAAGCGQRGTQNVISDEEYEEEMMKAYEEEGMGEGEVDMAGSEAAEGAEQTAPGAEEAAPAEQSAPPESAEEGEADEPGSSD